MIIFLGLLFFVGSSCAPGPEDSDEPQETTLAEEDSLPELIGLVWQWRQTLMGNDDRWVPEDPGTYTVQFMPDGTLAVLADCNQVRGGYTLEGGRLSIDLGPSTMMACPEGSLSDQFTANLSAANGFLFDGGDLLIDLAYDSGTMRFASSTQDLSGSAWAVTGYNNGQGGVVSIDPGTELTAEFSPDGNLSGSSGCNTYRGSYETDGKSLTIGPLASTRMFCEEPGGIMDQELAYLSALATAATFEFIGNRLEFRTADGSIAATFESAR
jgi:heat shock protein HslJ